MVEITVPAAYQGISGIAHGGYVAGLVAEHVGEPLRVAFRRPPPLETPLVLTDDGKALRLVDPHGRVIVEARASRAIEGDVAVVPLAEARSRPAHPRFAEHPYPRCFVCGTQRDDGFGLKVSAPDGDGLAVGVWVPSGPLLPDGPTTPAAFLWAVVDCLTVWTFADRWGDAAWWPAVTGRLAVSPLAGVPRDEPHVVVGRMVGRDGRRVTLQASVLDADGAVCAHAEAVWVVVPETPAPPTGSGPPAPGPASPEPGSASPA